MEEAPRQEKIQKEEVLEMLRMGGLEDPEVKELVHRWTAQQEAAISEQKTDGEKARKMRIAFEIERADLYVAVGDIGGALECLDDARLEAQQENEAELYEQIMRKRDEIIALEG